MQWVVPWEDHQRDQLPGLEGMLVYYTDMKTLDEAIKHAREMAAGQLEEGKSDCAYEHEQLAAWLEELIANRKRISEMSEMLNKQHQAAQAQVEDERDACERAVQFLLDVAEENRDEETTPESIGMDHYIRAMKQAVDTIQSRKDIGARTIQEMAHGTMIGEFVQRCVTEALEKDRARREPPPKDRPKDSEDQHPGWHGSLVIAEGNMASGAQLTKDADHLEDLADTGYYDNTCDSGNVLRAMAAWLRKMAAR